MKIAKKLCSWHQSCYFWCLYQTSIYKKWFNVQEQQIDDLKGKKHTSKHIFAVLHAHGCAFSWSILSMIRHKRGAIHFDVIFHVSKKSSMERGSCTHPTLNGAHNLSKCSKRVKISKSHRIHIQSSLFSNFATSKFNGKIQLYTLDRSVFLHHYVCKTIEKLFCDE